MGILGNGVQGTFPKPCYWRYFLNANFRRLCVSMHSDYKLLQVAYSQCIFKLKTLRQKMPALALQEAFKAAEKKQLKLSLPVTTRWNTYNEMLRRLIYSKDQINSAIWSQIILNMKSKKADDLQQIFCRTNFWQLADDLFKMSDPIAKTITQIEGYICRC